MSRRWQRRSLNDGDGDIGESTSTTTTAHLVTSGALLLSGDFEDCNHPLDAACEGGVASVVAYARHLIDTEQEHTTFIQKFDKKSPFVNTHELQWVVNRLILNGIFGFNVFISNPSLLLQNSIDSDVSSRDISDLQTHDMPLLLSNSQIPPSSSWNLYTKSIHFDESTGLAIANIADEDVPLYENQVDAARGILNVIAKINRENRCYVNNNDDTTTTTSYSDYLQRFQTMIDQLSMNDTSSTTSQINETENSGEIPTLPDPNSALLSSTEDDDEQKPCWISVLLYQDKQDKYATFLQEITKHIHPPDIIMNLEESYESYPIPQLYNDNSTTTWVGTCPMDDDVYCQHSITTTTTTTTTNNNGTKLRHRKVTDIQFIEHDLEELPDEYKDPIWYDHVTQLRVLANDAERNNPTIGFTLRMPAVRDGEIRYCQAGECAIGNLFTDALRWYTDADIAFVASGGFKGNGWDAGVVKLDYLYSALQFPNTECVGKMTGISLFRMLEFVTRIVPFDAIDSDEGDQLLQVSGMKITYNTRIPIGTSRLIGVEVLNKETGQYEAIERLKLYSFVTDSYLCGAYLRYPEFTGSALVLPGEVPGVIGDDEIIQNMVANFLGQLDEPYDTSTQGRLRNNTNAFEVLDLLQSKEECPQNTVWNAEQVTCLPCPTFENVAFSDELLEYQSENNAMERQLGRIVLVNREIFDVSVLLKSKPRWLGFTNVTNNEEVLDSSSTIELAAGESIAMQFALNPSNLLASGTDRSAIASVNFGVLGGDADANVGCVGRDVTFEVALRVMPADELNNLGWIRYVGFGLFGLVMVTAMAFAAVGVQEPPDAGCENPPTRLPDVHSDGRAAAIIRDHSVIDRRRCDVAMGLRSRMHEHPVVAVDRLHRIILRPVLQALAHQPSLQRGAEIPTRGREDAERRRSFCRHIRAQRRAPAHVDHRGPVEVGTKGNRQPEVEYVRFVPRQRQRVDRDGIRTRRAQLPVPAAVMPPTYIARNISGEFSESTYIGIAVYGWMQIMLVGAPILLLIDEGNPTATYFIQVALVFIVSMSMLLLIFVPGFINKKKIAASQRDMSEKTHFERSVRQQSKELSKMAVIESMARRTSFQHINNIETSSSPDVSQTFQAQPVPEVVVESLQRIEESSCDSDDDSSEESLNPLEAARARKREIEDKIQHNMHQSVNHNILGMADGDSRIMIDHDGAGDGDEAPRHHSNGMMMETNDMEQQQEGSSRSRRLNLLNKRLGKSFGIGIGDGSSTSNDEGGTDKTDFTMNDSA
eukprot:CAMPEP_0119549126 /NCGR_PEP_ID=MMETSP1352-20130426/2901_1 /TAXON_ID=265584 /ORGANISM="Stauroneis constricta, Strain CCMP1120" /LENGTH=1270 /DNA_ID=CAMNT_0007594597 /DNA_START=577 /DNA_END=4389 /DNA_ORIENTATION=+